MFLSLLCLSLPPASLPRVQSTATAQNWWPGVPHPPRHSRAPPRSHAGAFTVTSIGKDSGTGIGTGTGTGTGTLKVQV